MYKPLQKKSSSWTVTSIQKKSKNFSKPGSSAVQPKRDANSAQSQDMPSYSTAAADLLTGSIMRSVETEEHSEVESSTVQRQSDSGRAAVAATAPPIVSIPVVQPNSVGIQRQCSECAEKQQQQSGEEGKDVDEISLAANGIQTKLTVGAIGDVYEQEADRVAAQVMSMPVAAAAGPQVQRFGVEDSPVGMYSSLARSITPVVQRRVHEQVQMRSLVQRAFRGSGNEASGDLESRLNASKGGGSALAPEVRAFMEPRFGADFSSVRVHTGGEAVQMNRELGAQAFAHGSDVYFGAGKSPGNNELTAHELTHVVQQTSSTNSPIQRECGVDESCEEPNYTPVTPEPNASYPEPNYTPVTPEPNASYPEPNYTPANANTSNERPASTEQNYTPAEQTPADQTAADQTAADQDSGEENATYPGALPAGNNQLFFEYNSAVLSYSDETEIAAYVEKWRNIPVPWTDQVHVDAYASEEGQEAYNYGLASRRAQAVKEKLVSLGMPTQKIAVSSHGETTSFSKDDLRQNRRAVLSPLPDSQIPPLVKEDQPPVKEDQPPVKEDQPPVNAGNNCDSISSSTNWSLTSVGAGGGGAGVAVTGIAFLLKDLSPYGCTYHASFAGIGFGGGGKIKGKSVPLTLSIPSATSFTTPPVTVSDFNGGGRVFMADLGFGPGRCVGRASLPIPTTPNWLDIGGYELAVGASIGIYVGKWTAN
jgi:outer membrane protein OmpA-like peptidoglycan-associated protein